jgi:hypothetical protein
LLLNSPRLAVLFIGRTTNLSWLLNSPKFAILFIGRTTNLAILPIGCTTNLNDVPTTNLSGLLNDTLLAILTFSARNFLSIRALLKEYA